MLAASRSASNVSRMSKGCLGTTAPGAQPKTQAFPESRRLAAAERQSAQEREQLRDLQERLLRTEQFADATLASEAQAKAQITELEQALGVSLISCRACRMH